MNRIAFTKKLMLMLARSARQAERTAKLNLVHEIKEDVENLWRFLAMMREHNSIDENTYHVYVQKFSLLRKLVAKKEAMYQ